MLKEGRSKAFIENLRLIDENLEKLKLYKVEINRESREINYDFICDRIVPENLQNMILDYCNKETPKNFSGVTVSIKKIVSDSELVVNHIYKFIASRYPSLLFEFSEKDISTVKIGDIIKFTIKFIDSAKTYCDKNNTVNEIIKDLELNFCDDFSGEVVLKPMTKDVNISSTVISMSDLQNISKRTITVSDVIVIDDIEKPTIALYIDDADSVGDVTLCGRITEIKERQTSTGKPFYIIDFTDNTSKIGGIYFTKKNTIDRIKKLTENDEIIVRGKLDYYKDKLSLTINKINLCTLPKNFVPIKKEGNVASLSYKLVFPTEAENVKETTIFNMNETLPSCLTDNEFVVFDIETTGVDYEKDEITEIGAVKIVGGKIVQKFQTLVKPDQKISNEITELTGIDDELVKDAPKFREVIGDFFKFAGNSILVAHNADFDYKFMKYYAKPLNYFFTNKVIDTVQLSRDVVLGLSNYKLNTVAEHFNIKFHHHRALSDAFATGEVLIELLKIKKSLPNL